MYVYEKKPRIFHWDQTLGLQRDTVVRIIFHYIKKPSRFANFCVHSTMQALNFRCWKYKKASRLSVDGLATTYCTLLQVFTLKCHGIWTLWNKEHFHFSLWRNEQLNI